MELTKEHFEKHLSEQLNSIQEKMVSKEDLSSTKLEFRKQFEEVHNRLDNITTAMVTKDELKDSLDAQTKVLQDYTDQVAETIIEAVDSRVNKLEKRIVILETVK